LKKRIGLIWSVREGKKVITKKNRNVEIQMMMKPKEIQDISGFSSGNPSQE
jgi:hypothetical protein